MHIADGILSPVVCGVTGVAAVGAVALSMRQMERSLSVRAVPLTGMMAALIFAGQMINFPIGVPVSGHLLGGVLAAVVVGPWAGCLALTMVLLVQLALFADGGWLASGANVLNMAVVGSLGGYAVYALIRQWIGGSRGVVVGAIVAAWLSVLAASTLFCVEFGLSHPGGEFNLAQIFVLMTSFHSLIGIGEALITGMVLSAIVSQRPDLIYRPDHELAAAAPLTGARVTGAGQWVWGGIAGTGRALWVGLVVALAVAAFLAPFASDLPDGLEAVAERLSFSPPEGAAQVSVFADYDQVKLPGFDMSDRFWQMISVSLAGLLGTTSVFAMTLVFGRLLKPRLPATEAGHAR